MNATELLTAIGGRAPQATDGVSLIATRGPVEVVLARDASDAGLRKAWRSRDRGQPMLVLGDAPGSLGQVRVVGPSDAQAPVRQVPVYRLAELLQRQGDANRLTAVREVAVELVRLDEAGVPGVVVKDLLTRHLVQERLRTSPRWVEMTTLTSSVPPAADWRSLLETLGYDVVNRPRRGRLLRSGDSPVAVLHPMASSASFSQLDESGRPPEGLLALDCHAEGVRYGLLASGSRLRLFRAGADAEHGGSAATTSYLELDAADLRPEDRPLLALLAPASLAAGGWFDELVEEARQFGGALRERLDEEIRTTVLPALARGLGSWLRTEEYDLADAATRAAVEAASITWVFRALFVLYAESAGYLPIDHAGYRATALTDLTEQAAETISSLDRRSTSLWDRFGVLVKALRTGDTAIGVPAYNGDLFARDALPGAELLERASVANDVFGPVLAALGRDSATGVGVDYSSLDVGHLGHLYEGLLSLHVSVADADLGLYPRGTGSRKEIVYEAVRAGTDVAVQAGELFWQTNTGGRKAGGVYYTPDLLVEHLVGRAVLPTLETHLDQVRELAGADPAAAAERLFAFRVLDPACGSAHFLTSALHRIAERMDRFLAETPLPAVRSELEALRAAADSLAAGRIEHADLLHRLVLKRCIYGVDVSIMGAEVARLSLWLAAFVPGLSLAYLGHNVQVGDALVGVGDPAVLAAAEERGMRPIYARAVDDSIAEGADAAAALAALNDRTPDEVAASHAANDRLQAATAGVRRLYDAWTAGPLGVPKARALVDTTPVELISGDVALPDEARAAVEQVRALHWPLAFPEVFVGDRPGFDAVIGNPPWEEVTVEELAFYARYAPRLRGLSAGPRAEALHALQRERPDLGAEFAVEQQRVARLRAFLSPAGGFYGTAGDPDLYKAFCQRYRTVLAAGGRLGVVLPRSVFLADGSRQFRRWLFDSSVVERVDFLLNKGSWAFAMEPRYTVATLVARASAPDGSVAAEVAGVASSASAFAAQSTNAGVTLTRGALGTNDEIPLLPSQAAEPVLARIRSHGDFAHGGGRWRCFPVGEFHETNDRSLWEKASSGWALCKGESFDQFDPPGHESRHCPPTAAALKKARKPRPGSGSVLAGELSVAQRREAVSVEVGGVRLAFRDVSRATDSRTVRAALTPGQTFLTNKAPYLAFVDGDHRQRSACCAVLNSLPFDWQARRFVETNVNFFILELLRVPVLDDRTYSELVRLGARLSCPDERFAEVAAACDVPYGPLSVDERLSMRAQIDALVGVAYGLTVDDMEIGMEDFTLAAVPEDHREAIRREMKSLCP